MIRFEWKSGCTHAAHATALKGSGHIPDFTEKLKRPEKSSTIDVISTMTRTQREDGMASKQRINIDVADIQQTRAC